jgi:hypothetical protein
MLDFDQGGNSIPSLHCESFTNVEHNTDDYHHYQIATDDDDAPALGRLSKRHRVYTNLKALCSSESLSIVASGGLYSEPCGHDNLNASSCLSDDHTASSDTSSDDGWGYYVDTL